MIIAPESTPTDRFILRSWLPGDGPQLREATLESYDHLKPWMPWATETQTEEEAELLVRRFRGNWLLSTDFCIAIFDPTNTRALGGCGFHLREGPLKTGSAEIGMWIRASEAGTGLGSAVLTELVRWGFDAWPWERLVWSCHADNAASARLAEKVGFELEGVHRGQYSPIYGRRDTRVYSRLRPH